MYASPNRLTSHRLAPLDVPVPSWMRAPGECPGMFGPEVALDELAERCGLDPIELRIRNEPAVDPESGNPFSTRRLVECLREGAKQFGWTARDPQPGPHREGDWLTGYGVASATYPVNRIPGSAARICFTGDDTYVVEIGAADIGQGPWTTLAQIAADALEVPIERDRSANRRHTPARRVSRRRLVGDHQLGLGDRRRRRKLPPAVRATIPPPAMRSPSRPPKIPKLTATPCTPSAPNSRRCECTPTPARSGYPGCSGYSTPARSSTPSSPARSSSEG